MSKLLSKLKDKYTPVYSINQLPHCIYKNMISTLFLLAFSFVFMLVGFIISFDILFLMVGIPLSLILTVLFILWIKDYLYGKILIVDGVITDFSNTEKNKQNLLQRKILYRYVRATFTVRLHDNTELQVVRSNNMRYKVGQTLRLYYTQDHLIENNGTYLLNQVSYIELLHV